MSYSLLFAFLAPVIWGFMNVFDKYVLAHKVKNTLGFVVVTGIANLLFGLGLGLSLEWPELKAEQLLYPIMAGIFFGIQFYFYYLILKKEDVSYMVGLVFTYPLIVALLSWTFLAERLSLIGYLGIILILVGVVLLHGRLKLHLETKLWMLGTMILLVAGSEFFIKIATTTLPALHGIAINNVMISLTLFPGLLHQKTRRGFWKELKNIRWAFASEFLTFSAIFSLYFAMKGLPATIVSSISSLQALAVVIFERIAHHKYGKITKDTLLRPKLIAILLIVIGVCVLYLSELIHL